MRRGSLGKGRGGRWGAAVVGLSALAVSAGCSSSPAVSNRVVVIGDSSAALQYPDLAAALRGRDPVTPVIRPHGRIGAVAKAARTPLATGGTPRFVVVNLGTDDALRPGADKGAAAALQPVVDAVRSVPCIVVTTVSLGADHRGGSTLASRIDNQVLRLAATDPTRVKVVDWQHFLATLPPQVTASYVRPDGVHPTTSGAQWLARSDVAGIEACGSPTQPTVLGTPTG